jgi:hypothetical protein
MRAFGTWAPMSAPILAAKSSCAGVDEPLITKQVGQALVIAHGVTADGTVVAVAAAAAAVVAVAAVAAAAEGSVVAAADDAADAADVADDVAVAVEAAASQSQAAITPPPSPNLAAASRLCLSENPSWRNCPRRVSCSSWDPLLPVPSLEAMRQNTTPPLPLEL